MSGPRHHFLPAAVIGRFAPGQDFTPARDRKIWVLRRTGTITRQAASTVAYQNNLYGNGDVYLSGIRHGKPTEILLDVDAYWTPSEQDANPATDAIQAAAPGPYPADAWMRLAAYIASIFARSPDFPDDLAKRFGHTPGNELTPILTRQNANAVRFLENHRVSAAVARARWTVLLSPSQPLIMNDRGATALYHVHHNTYGYAVPLRPSLAIGLERGPWDKPIIWADDAWHIIIETATLDTAEAKNLNEATWLQCRREVYASNDTELHRLKTHDPTPPSDAVTADDFNNARHLGLTPSQRMASENLLQRFETGIPAPRDPAHPPILKI